MKADIELPSSLTSKIYYKVDGPYFVTFCCLLPYTTQICETEISVSMQMCMKKPGSISETLLELISNFYELLDSIDSEP